MRVAIGYAIAALALGEGADVFLPGLGYPDLVQPILIALVAGFPVALIASWALQVTPAGVVTDEVARELDVRAARPDGHSVAVLPFADMSPQGDQEYFADGMAEELINALTKLGGIKVAARTSTFALKGREDDVREIGRALGVSTVLEGSVRKSGDRLRVTAQLIDVDDGMHLFSESYDRELADVFTVQDEITREVVGALQVTLLDGSAKLVSPSTSSMEAYDLYLKGRYHWHRRYKVGLETALQYFLRASELDPDYALPHTGIADTFTVFGLYGFVRADAAIARAGPAVESALALDPSLPEAHFSRGLMLYTFAHDHEGCRAAFRQALRHKPGFGEAQGWIGASLISQGHFEEGLAQLDLALPMDPHSVYLKEVTAIGYGWARRFERALEICDSALAIEPDSLIALYVSAFAHSGLGQVADARSAMERVVEISGRHPVWLAWLARLHRLSGDEEGVERCRREIMSIHEEEHVPQSVFIVLHAGLGEVDEAWAALVRSDGEGGFPGLSAVGMTYFDPVRSDGRFQERWKSIGVDIDAWP